jgi:glycosyltransferase involved in cell wall biosynthesis
MKRERTNKRELGQASLIVTGTLRGASEISKAYGVEADRIIISPFPVAKPSHKSHLKRDPMLFFYPAQFWPHKNHITLLHAFAAAKNQTNLDLRLVLCGSDKGNEAHVQRYVRNLNLEANVEIKGFVSNEELRELYLSAGMMLFPSFFGPDNLPPLEAMSYGCPVAVADVPGAREQLGDAARFFAPNSVSELAKVISSAATQPEKNLEKVSKGSLLASERNPERYVATVLDRIFELETIIWNFPR